MNITIKYNNNNLLSKLKFSKYFSSKRAQVERYIEQQANDQYSRRSREHLYRARSAFKLLQINEKFNFIKPGMVAIDIGAAPGSWCQVLSELIFLENVDRSKNHGYILGVDILSIAPIENVDLLSGADITKAATQSEIRRRLAGRRVDLMVSDMAPNPTGESFTDHLKILNLCRELVKFGTTSETDGTGYPLLADNGIFLCKIFDGPQRKEFASEIKEQFKIVKNVKPDASRDSSSETYIFAIGFKSKKKLLK